MTDLLLIIVLGYVANIVGVLVYTIWFGIITLDEVSSTKAFTYSNSKNYNLFNSVRVFVPYLVLFKVYEYIITYSVIKKQADRQGKLRSSKKSVFEILALTDITMKEKENK